jgi:hypothetical protein
MMRVLVLSAAVAFSLASSTHATPSSTHERPAAAAVKLAKAPKKKKADKPPEKAPEKVAPEGARSDPRTSSPPPDAAPAPAAADPGARRGMGRIEFDDRLIQGQTNKANAIYLFERRESALRSLLKKRTDFHEEIDETLE